jgi:hypothetical protein
MATTDTTPAPPPAVVDPKSFYARLDEGTKDYLGKVPVATMVGWFGAGGLTFFQLPQRLTDGTARAVPMSIDPFSVPIAIFQDDAVIRVYSLPALAPDPRPAEWVDRAPRRFTLTKGAPTLVIEELPLAVMADEIIHEWEELAEGMNLADLELERIVALIDSIDPLQPPGANKEEWINKAELLEALEAHEHRENDDEEELEDEPEPEVNGAQPPAPPPVPQPPARG